MTTPSHDWKSTGGAPGLPRWNRGRKVRRGDEMVWWRCHKLSLPHWSSAAYNLNLALVQPSSTAAERVFSILRSHFDDHQAGALEDSLEAAVMVAYNYPGWLTVHLSDAQMDTLARAWAQPLPLPLPAVLLSFVNRHTCTYKLTHTCAKPHWYRHILIHVTTCLDINFYLPFTVQYLIKYTNDQKFVSWCASTVEHNFTFWALNGH